MAHRHRAQQCSVTKVQMRPLASVEYRKTPTALLQTPSTLLTDRLAGGVVAHMTFSVTFHHLYRVSVLSFRFALTTTTLCCCRCWSFCFATTLALTLVAAA